jgi:arylsulfatase A-like enzyme
MAKEGIRFTDFYAAVTCSPSRGSLLTGCYAQRLEIGGPINNPKKGLNPDEITLAESLKEKGYATALIGKWHLGLPDEMSPVSQGFDYFSGIPLSHIRHGITEHTEGPTAYYQRQWKTMGIDLETKIEINPNDTLFTQRVTKESLQFIRDNHRNPFFLFISHPQVHKEVLASKSFQGRTKRGRYGDACEELDWSVGEVIKLLKTLDIDDNTLLIFASDNGPWLDQGDESGTAAPLRGGKFSTWEGGIRVPCIMRWPGHIAQGKVCNKVASIMDIFPTFIHLIGGSMPDDRIIDGKDIWPLISSEGNVKSPYNHYFYYSYGNLFGVRKGDWKLHLNNGDWELYNLKQDISELSDRSLEYPEKVEELQELLSKARKDLGDARKNLKGDNVRAIGEVK